MLTLEEEWWRDTIDPTWRWSNVSAPIIAAMGDARLQFPSNFLRTEVYMGYFDDDNIDDSTQVAFMEQNIDRYLLHHYTSYSSDFMRTGYSERYLKIGKYSAKPMEIWPIFSSQYNPCSSSDYQGYIMKNDPTLNTLSKIEEKFRSVYNNKIISGYFNGSPNFKLGGNMWFAYGSKCLQEFTAGTTPNSVSLGRHILKNFKDCPINVHASMTGNAPFTIYWKFPDGSSSTTTGVIKPFDDQLVKGWGRVEVTVYDGLGRVSTDYVNIYTDAEFYMDCIAVDSLVAKNPVHPLFEFGELTSQVVDNNILTIKSQETNSFYSIRVINYSGQVIAKSATKFGENERVQFSLPPGFYIIVLEDQHGNIKRKGISI